MKIRFYLNKNLPRRRVFQIGNYLDALVFMFKWFDIAIWKKGVPDE
jgi:hypothetical protein